MGNAVGFVRSGPWRMVLLTLVTLQAGCIVLKEGGSADACVDGCGGSGGGGDADRDAAARPDLPDVDRERRDGRPPVPDMFRGEGGQPGDPCDQACETVGECLTERELCPSLEPSDRPAVERMCQALCEEEPVVALIVNDQDDCETTIRFITTGPNEDFATCEQVPQDPCEPACTTVAECATTDVHCPGLARADRQALYEVCIETCEHHPALASIVNGQNTCDDTIMFVISQDADFAASCEGDTCGGDRIELNERCDPDNDCCGDGRRCFDDQIGGVPTCRQRCEGGRICEPHEGCVADRDDGVQLCLGECEVFRDDCRGEVCNLRWISVDDRFLGRCLPGPQTATTGDACEILDDQTGASDCEEGHVCAQIMEDAEMECVRLCDLDKLVCPLDFRCVVGVFGGAADANQAVGICLDE